MAAARPLALVAPEQAVLNFRSLAKSERFDDAFCGLLLHRRAYALVTNPAGAVPKLALAA